MSNQETVIRLIADLELAGADAVAKQIKKVMAFDDRDFLSKWSRVQKKAESTFGQTIGDALRTGFSGKNLRGLTDTYTKLSRLIEEAQKDGATKAAKIQAQAMEKRFKAEQRQLARINQRRKDALQAAQGYRGVSGLLGAGAHGAKGLFEQLRGGDFSGAIKGVGQGVQAAGGAAIKAGSKGSGGFAKALGEVGGLLSKLGPYILAVGALVGSVAALVAIFISAESQMKQLNRTILESGIAGAELGSVFDDVGKKIADVRRTFTAGEGAFAFNNIWGTTAKDHLVILGAYADAGKTLREMRAEAAGFNDEMERLREYTQSALAYSKLLGVSAQDMAGNMGSWMEDLGADLQYINEGLSGVTMAAKESGFGVKRFYGMILQATSGMGMYNVRLEEAGGLLIRLGQVLGAKTGGDFLQQLTKGFAGESMQDRWKRDMLTRGSKGIFTRSAEATGTDFISKLRTMQDKGAQARIMGLLGFSDLDTATGAGLSKRLGSMGRKQREGLLASMRLTGQHDLTRSLTNLMDVAEGAVGGRGARAVRMGSLDMGGKLAAKMAHGQTIIGKPLHMMNPREMMGFEGVAGVTGEEREQLLRISEAMYGNWNTLRKMEGKQVTPEQQREQAKAFGAAIDDQGRVLAASFNESTGEIEWGTSSLKSLEDYIQTQGQVFKEAAQQAVPADIKLAAEIAANTTDIASLLERGVEYWLEQIYTSVERISSWMGGLSGGEKAERERIVSGYTREIRDMRAKERGISQEMSELRKEMNASSGPDRERAQAALKVKAEELRVLRGRKAVKEEHLREAQSYNKSGWFTDKGASELRRDIEAGVGPKSIEKALRGKAGMSKEQISAIKKKGVQRMLLREGVGSEEELVARQSQARERHFGLLATVGLGAQGGRGASVGTAPMSGEDMIKKAQEDALMAYGREDWRRTQRLHGKGGEAPKAIGEEWRKQATMLTAENMATQMAAGLSGVETGLLRDDFLGLATQYRESGEMPAEIAKHLDTVVGGKSVREKFTEMGLPVFEAAGVAQDYLMHIGKGGVYGQRISTQDDVQVVASKAGGPLSRGGGGGGDVYINYHEYASPHGWTQNQSKLKRVMAGRVG